MTLPLIVKNNNLWNYRPSYWFSIYKKTPSVGVFFQ